jgi:N-acetylmuramoyl-L-alanine amidase CwlA
MTIIQKPSPNKDGNRQPIIQIVIHWIVGNLAAADAVFAKPNSTSAHYGIEDDRVHQYVPENMVAYHAGVYSVNQRSIGIEHSAAPDRPASNKTYETSAQLIREIAKRHNIPLDRQHIIKHSQVKNTQCPGTMDLDRLIRMAKENSQPTPQPPPAVSDDLFRVIHKGKQLGAFKQNPITKIEAYESFLDDVDLGIEKLRAK